MAEAKIIRIYLNDNELKRAKRGDFNFLNVIRNAVQPYGFRVEFRRNSDEEWLKSAGRNGYSLFHMEDPFHECALNFRRSYFFPFWRIEAAQKRWDFDVAKKAFDPEALNAETCTIWANNWRNWLFKIKDTAFERDGPVYVPLQGRPLRQRSFQAASPIEMLEHTIARYQKDPIIVGLHPGEKYSDEEMAVLNDLKSEHTDLQFVTGKMDRFLKNCRCVVTQNSSAALFGYFFHKPALLYGKIDFHHISANVHELGVEAAFDALETTLPEFDRYLYWFTMENAIKADADDAEAQVIAVLKRHKWLD